MPGYAQNLRSPLLEISPSVNTRHVSVPTYSHSEATSRSQMPPQVHYTTLVPPRLAMFSGEGQKGESSYAQWRSELDNVWHSGLYQEVLIMNSVRNSLHGRAADALLAMGSNVSVEQVLARVDVRFGDVRPSDRTLQQFFTARQLTNESVSAWGCRLEDLLSQVNDPDGAVAARSMLRSQYWSGLYSDQIRNALRHHFDEGIDFEALLSQARIAEQEPCMMATQQGVYSLDQDKLDTLIQQLKALVSKVQKLENHVCWCPEFSLQCGTR